MEATVGVSRYGRPLEFGVFVVPTSDDLEVAGEQAAIADELGLDLVGIQDHPYQWRYLETWALIADLLARTERVRFFPDGSSTGGRISLIAGEREWQVEIAWLTGEVRLREAPK